MHGRCTAKIYEPSQCGIEYKFIWYLIAKTESVRRTNYPLVHFMQLYAIFLSILLMITTKAPTITFYSPHFFLLILVLSSTSTTTSWQCVGKSNPNPMNPFISNVSDFDDNLNVFNWNVFQLVVATWLWEPPHITRPICSIQFMVLCDRMNSITLHPIAFLFV